MSQETDVRAKNAEAMALALEKRVAALEQTAKDLTRTIQEFWDVYQEEKPKKK